MFSIIPERQQKAEPVSFEAVQPLDVEDWVKINISTRCEGYSPQPETLRDKRPPPRNPTLDDHESRLPKSSHRTNIESERHPHFEVHQLQAAGNTAERSNPEKLLRAQLFQVQEALSKAVETMGQLDEEDSAGARLRHLSSILRLVEREVELLVLCGACDDPRTATSPRSSEPNQDGQAAIDTVSDVSDSSSNIPDALSEFFEYAREVNLLQERISECVFVEAQPDTIEGRKDGDSSDRVQGDGKVDESKIIGLRAALLVAKDRMAAQREKCLAEGLDPERLRYRRRSSASA